MAIVLMGLGNWRFSVPGQSYDRLVRRFEYRWEPQMRVGMRPAEQFMGPGEEMLDIRGVLYPHYAGGYNQLNDMRAAAMSGVPYGLADAKGIYYGRWCIRMIRDEQEYFHPNGDPRKVEFSIDLVNYGEEAGGEGFTTIQEQWSGTWSGRRPPLNIN
jgi:phage protein U